MLYPIFLYRKEDAIKLELVHIAKLDQNGTRFFYQKKKFQLPQYVPYSLPGTQQLPGKHGLTFLLAEFAKHLSVFRVRTHSLQWKGPLSIPVITV